jgi:hypothetical protein
MVLDTLACHQACDQVSSDPYTFRQAPPSERMAISKKNTYLSVNQMCVYRRLRREHE